jgi:hypothetical protein
MRIRLGLFAVVAVLGASAAAFTSPASASLMPTATRTGALSLPTGAIGLPTGGISAPIPCTIGGVASTCQLQVTSLQLVNDVLTAAGTVTGNRITVPFSGAAVDTGGTCQILDLTLGPLQLDLLGLVVDLNQVHLNITAQQGSGNLLGNLLCAVSHLLDNTGNTTTALNQIVNLLNQILARL